MRKPYIRTAVLAVMLAWTSASRLLAAPFVNLDFEQSTVQPSDPTVDPVSAAFPGWTARFDGAQTNFVYHNVAGAGEPTRRWSRHREMCLKVVTLNLMILAHASSGR